MSFRIWLCVIVLSGAAGCGWGEDKSTAAAEPAKAPATPVAPKAPPLDKDMVSAVSGAKSSAIVDLKFRLGARPEPGQPIDIDIAVIPKVAGARVRVLLQNVDGLEIRSGQEMPVSETVAAGEPLSHRVTVVPARDGVFAMTAVALVDTDQTSVTRTFAIPVIVGQGTLMDESQVTGSGAQPP